jgi:Zn-dependent metalloprotease
MNNISQCSCGVIPPHILRRLAHAGDAEAKAKALGTLEEMQAIAKQRDQFLISKDAYAQGPAVAKQRNVYDAQQHRTLPGKRVRSESDPQSHDVEVNEAFDGSGVTYDFYDRVFGRTSIDGKGMPINASVHYGKNFDNAMWNGSQMVYGDGDGKVFNRFTLALDVIGHELTHGVTQFTAALDYSGQTGALNEHISDAFGIMVKQYALGLTAKQSDWLIGAGLLAAGVKGKAIRSMAAPGTAYDDPRLGRDPQPSRMHDYVVTDDDGGGIHINSGIPNHAFYLAAVALGGNTWEVLGKVWYAALTEKTEPDAEFRDFANATVIAAGDLFGNGGTVQRNVSNAWSKVGLAIRSRFTGVRAPRWRTRPAAARRSTSERKKGELS